MYTRSSIASVQGYQIRTRYCTTNMGEPIFQHLETGQSFSAFAQVWGLKCRSSLRHAFEKVEHKGLVAM